MGLYSNVLFPRFYDCVADKPFWARYRKEQLASVEGEILEINAEVATLAISLQHSPPDKLPLCLVLALPRPKMLRRILRSVAEFGVAELHLINSYRVEKSYWQSPVLEGGAIREYLLQGLEQSRDMTLIATFRPRRRSSARYTLPKLPCPIFRSISYLSSSTKGSFIPLPLVS